MAANLETSAYLLSYRRKDSDEDKRLNSQHDVIKQAILDGHLIHPSIPISDLEGSIADVACGTGIWLEDVRKTHFTDLARDLRRTPMLVGFDVNSHAFDPTLDPSINLVQHDCTREFSPEYVGKFGLVNMRGLAYAIPREKFSQLLNNVITLLRPGGYIQWLETEARLFRQFPTTESFRKAITRIDAERRNRELVINMPQFMLRELLAQQPQPPAGSFEYLNDMISILSFSLVPGGICRDLQARDDVVNRRLSATILESIRLLLAASLNQNREDGAAEVTMRLHEQDQISTRELIEAIAVSMECNEIIAGGVFPLLIARKTGT